MTRDTVRERRRNDLNIVIDNGNRTSLIATLIKELATGKLDPEQRAVYQQAYDHYTGKSAPKENEPATPVESNPFTA